MSSGFSEADAGVRGYHGRRVAHSATFLSCQCGGDASAYAARDDKGGKMEEERTYCLYCGKQIFLMAVEIRKGIYAHKKCDQLRNGKVADEQDQHEH